MSGVKLFENKQIRSDWNEEEQEWFFAVVDVIAVLTDSADPKDYWYRMKKREKLSGFELSTICRQLKLVATDGKKYATDCASKQGLLRIIQSVPSPKAEPFKQWLAQVGAERIAEIENPELAQARIRATYKAKGYSDAWIEKRIRGIQVRDELTNEWKQRGVKEGKEYSILTAEISKATFGIIPSEYKNLKGLTKANENLRDHMSDLELIFTMLGEASTTEIAKNKNATGFVENHKAAKEGGTIAGNARKELEKKSGAKVISKQNFKNLGITNELKENNDV
ncbi:phage antirepressor protein [Pedobacter changchengzhani]|uniref:Phage antirepressor protein n=1 Tax=Pedobacter changchengzhani TaxID=2529274 RepID=A0A4R5ML08_9SPHI|nr:Bro-N domain-containing protein [Pedobacter changchengzhani]TDG36351.1 phage antirepressor protein [Pedobacter changchengzhani]